jgi:hypothetical protein
MRPAGAKVVCICSSVYVAAQRPLTHLHPSMAPEIASSYMCHIEDLALCHFSMHLLNRLFDHGAYDVIVCVPVFMYAGWAMPLDEACNIQAMQYLSQDSMCSPFQFIAHCCRGSDGMSHTVMHYCADAVAPIESSHACWLGPVTLAPLAAHMQRYTCQAAATALCCYHVRMSDTLREV